MSSATMSAHPVIASPRARVLFLVCAAIGLALFFWTRELRHVRDFLGLSPIFFVLFVHFDSPAAMLAVGILLIAALVPFRQETLGGLTWLGTHPRIVAALTTLVFGAGSLFSYLNHPLSMDEFAPYFQSQVFAAGHLTGQYPPELLDWLIPLEFHNTFLAVSRESGAVVSGYWPSFALLLTPFTWLGIPWACNPVLSGLSILAMHSVAIRLFGNARDAGFAVLLTVASPVFFADGISYYSMTAHMLANLLFVALVLDPAPRRLMLAGLVGSVALTLHNPVPHMLFATPWLAWLVLREGGWRNLAWLAAGYLPLCLVLGAGGFWFTSTWLHRGDELIGVRQLAGGADLFGLPTGRVWLARLVGVAKIWLWAVPGLLALASVGAWRWRADVRYRLLAASALLTLIGYLFVVPDQGHGWGFRYFHSAWLVLPLLAVAACRDTVPGDGEPAAFDAQLCSFFTVCALLCLLAGNAQRWMQIKEFISDNLTQLPAYRGTEPRVVLVRTDRAFYGNDLVHNDPFLRAPVIYLVASLSPDDTARAVERLRPGYARVYADERGEVWSAVAKGSP